MRLGEIRGKIESVVDDVYYKALSERNCSSDIAPLQYESFSSAVDMLTEILKSMIANNGTLNKIKNFIDNNNGQYKFPKGATMGGSESDLIYPVKLFRLFGSDPEEFSQATSIVKNLNRQLL